MAVMTDVREAAQNLIEYAIHRSMIGQDDRIWAYNTILECIGATGPALDMAWALQVEKLSLLHPDTLPNFDLEGTLAALAEAAVANGAAEDTASGRDRIAMRIMGALMPRPSVVNEEFNGRMGINEPRAATDWFYGLCCDAGYVRRAAIARNIKWSTPDQLGRPRDHYQPVEAREGPARYRRGRCSQEHGREVSRLPALHRKRGLSRTLCRSRRRCSPRPPESARYPHSAQRRALGLPVQPVCVL